MEQGVSDDQFPLHDPSDESDPAVLEQVRQELSRLSFLRPDEPTEGFQTDAPGDPMPEWAWQRLSAAIQAESGTPHRSPGWLRWGGGLVAASVAVLAIGLAVTSFSGSSEPSLVAEGAPDASVEAASDASVEVDSAIAPRAAAAGPTMLSFAGIVPPALKLVDTRTDYTSDELGTQVTEVLEEMGMEPAAAESAMADMPDEVMVPVPDPQGILASATRLRDCITELTQWATSTALLVDWATFDGQDAGVIVAPDYPAGDQSRPDMQELDIWVVDPECDVKVDLHIRMK